jgi:hypothetical protein
MARNSLLDAGEELEGYLDPKEVAEKHSARNPCLKVVWTGVVEYLLEADGQEVEEFEQLFGRKEHGLLKLGGLIEPLVVERLKSMTETGGWTDSRHVLCLPRYFLVGRF